MFWRFRSRPDPPLLPERPSFGLVFQSRRPGRSALRDQSLPWPGGGLSRADLN